jgi:hypothetical protein
MQGVMLIWIGFVNPTSPVTLVAGIQAMAFCMDAANGESSHRFLHMIDP